MKSKVRYLSRKIIPYVAILKIVEKLLEVVVMRCEPSLEFYTLHSWDFSR